MAKRKKPSPKLSQRTTGAVTHKLPSIISPWIDFICVGGLSIVVMLFLLVYILPTYSWNSAEAKVSIGSMIVLQALINWPHFMASYRLLYLPSENIRRYPAAAIVIPSVLVGIIILSIATGDGFSDGVLFVNQNVSYFLWLGAAFYLAWHYTGQAWGMVCTFSHLHNIKFLPRERFILRAGLRVLLAWHVIWGMQDLPESWLGFFYSWIPGLLNWVSIVAIVLFFASIYVFFAVRHRSGRFPTSQVVSPVISIYLWYLVLYFEPSAYVYVQLSHSLQYLIFPLRVEMNRKGMNVINFNNFKELIWGCKYYAMLVLFGCILFYFPNLLDTGNQQYTLGVLIASAIAIHHYFVDGAIWKLGNPYVRNTLFKHLKF